MIFATIFVSLLGVASALPTPQNTPSRSVFRVLAASDHASRAAMPQAAPSPPRDSSSSSSIPPAEPQQVSFDSCPVTPGGSSPAGVVHNITVSPCSRSADNEPCRFHYGQNYTIDIAYTSYLNAEEPRSGLSARDDSTDPSTSYPYSGQTFGACSYTDCPIQSGKASIYTYEFNTLLSPFDYLTFNVTQAVDRPSLFCAGFAAKFIDDSKSSSPSGGKKQKIKNPKKAEETQPAPSKDWK